MGYYFRYERVKIGELGRGGEGEEDAGEIDAHGGAVRGCDVGAVREVGGWGARLQGCGPGEGGEGLCGVEEVEEGLLLLLVGVGKGVGLVVVGLG